MPLDLEHVRVLKGVQGREVTLCRDSSGRLVVVKTVRGRTPDSRVMFKGDQVARELAAHLLLKPARCIVQLLGHDAVPGEPFTHALALEYCSGRDLDRLALHASVTGHLLPEPFVWHVLKQTIEALDYVTRSGVDHQDVHAGNLLLRFRGPIALHYPDVVLADFGLCHFLHDAEAEPTHHEAIGQLAYFLLTAVQQGGREVVERVMHSQQLLGWLETLSSAHGRTSRPFTLAFVREHLYPHIPRFMEASGPPQLPGWMAEYFWSLQDAIDDGASDSSSGWGEIDTMGESAADEVAAGEVAAGEVAAAGRQEQQGPEDLPPSISKEAPAADFVQTATDFLTKVQPNKYVALTMAKRGSEFDAENEQQVLERLEMVRGALVELVKATVKRYQLLRDDIEFDTFCTLTDYVCVCSGHMLECQRRMAQRDLRARSYLAWENEVLTSELGNRYETQASSTAASKLRFMQERSKESFDRFVQDFDSYLDASVLINEGQEWTRQLCGQDKDALLGWNGRLKERLGIEAGLPVHAYWVRTIKSQTVPVVEYQPKFGGWGSGGIEFREPVYEGAPSGTYASAGGEKSEEQSPVSPKTVRVKGQQRQKRVKGRGPQLVLAQDQAWEDAGHMKMARPLLLSDGGQGEMSPATAEMHDLYAAWRGQHPADVALLKHHKQLVEGRGEEAVRASLMRRGLLSADEATRWFLQLSQPAPRLVVANPDADTSSGSGSSSSSSSSSTRRV